MYTVASLDLKINNRIGKGGEGTVHEAVDRQLNTTFAVKIVPTTRFTNFDGYFAEARKLYLSRHHNVVPIQYACKTDENIYMAMPLFRKGSIADLMKVRFLTAHEVLRYSIQFLSGLNNIHAKGLVHFDIKPENFLISDSDSIMLSDFGMAEYAGNFGFADVRETTKLYAPPEYFSQGSKHNLKFDIYQAGLSIYRMCVGHEMFLKEAERAATVKGRKDNQNFINSLTSDKFWKGVTYLPHIPKALRRVVRKATHSDMDTRYGSVLDMLNDLSRIAEINRWQFQKFNDSQFQWTCGTRKVQAQIQSSAWETYADKADRKKKDFCRNNLTEKEKDDILYDCLNGSW